MVKEQSALLFIQSEVGRHVDSYFSQSPFREEKMQAASFSIWTRITDTISKANLLNYLLITEGPSINKELAIESIGS